MFTLDLHSFHIVLGVCSKWFYFKKNVNPFSFSPRSPGSDEYFVDEKLPLRQIPTYDQLSDRQAPHFKITNIFSGEALGEGVQLDFASNPQSWGKLYEIANQCMQFHDNQGPNRAFFM